MLRDILQTDFSMYSNLLDNYKTFPCIFLFFISCINLGKQNCKILERKHKKE